MDFADFIRAHEADDLAALALSRSRYGADVSLPGGYEGTASAFDLALSTLEVRRKLRTKVPSWYAAEGLVYPLRLSGEQCSGEAAARYKAGVAFSACREGALLADLTGGLGVDAWAFSQRFSKVFYNEMQPELAAAARYNFRELGLRNVTVRCRRLVPGGAALEKMLDGFRPDILFLDPARRAGDGRKVFRLEDCQPNVLQLLPELLEASPLVLLKLSPMADISLVCRQLRCVRQVHVVAADGECKELLLLLEKGYEGPCSITVFENGAALDVDDAFPVDQVQTCPGPGPVAGDKLFEPGKALLKAGAFDLPCRYGLQKLGKHTHLYAGEVPPVLQPFGKTFEVLETPPLDKRSIKELGTRYPKAAVTARNIPLTSGQLQKKLGVNGAGPVHIFGVRIDALGGNYLLVCR